MVGLGSMKTRRNTAGTVTNAPPAKNHRLFLFVLMG
jgi:hypothetical protein